ncbi:MAG TPA: tRNA 2-thiouridine(34) synthase MnmA [Acidimicrobiia bacterium]
MNVLVAMSGGVDSSVAAALMKSEGHDVIGVTLKLWSGPDGELPTAGCCTVSDAEDARRVAAQLDIPYYVLDYTDDFSSGVIDRFVDEYRHGRTPNPCVECNRTVKFSRLLAQASEFGCDIVATGHYARTGVQGGRHRLSRGVDRDKDQSYVLSMLGQAELSRVRFPVGVLDKAGTRRIAADLGLRTAAKRESMDICFVGARDYRSFLRDHAGVEDVPGPIVDVGGRTLAHHRGITGFTVGQRRGLGVAVGAPQYVIDVRPETATVVIGPKQALEVTGVEVARQTSVAGSPVQGRVLAQYRAHGEAVPAEVDGANVRFESPQYAVAPGQTVAFYRGDEVLGSAIISSVR